MSSHAPVKGSPSVLVTGASGLVGHELLDQLRQRDAVSTVGTSRRGSTAVQIAAWDMSSEQPPPQLQRDWDVIINAAANTRWTMSEEEATAANVSSVRALKSLASETTHVIHVSTAYAVGLRGDVESADLEDYRNTYEWSKAHAERVAHELFARLTIVRPPLIVGRRHDGRAARFSGMYTLIRGMTVGTVPAVIADPDARFDAIPVDDLCGLLADLVDDATAGDHSVHTIAAGQAAPTVEGAVGAILDSLNAWRLRQGREPLESPPFIPPDSWKRFYRPFVLEHLTARQQLILDLLASFEPYLALTAPLVPDRPVGDVLPCLKTSTDYWADTNPRLAELTPQPWRGMEERTVMKAEERHA